MAALRGEDLTDDDPVQTDPADPASPPLPCLTIRVGRTKTTTSDDDERVVLIGRPVVALRCWLEVADIKDGPGFRRIDQGKRRSARAHAAVGQSHPEKPLQASRARPDLAFGAWIAIRLPDRGGQSRHAAA